MSFLIDTSAMVHLLRDRTGGVARRYDDIVAGEPVFLNDLTVFELLRGARDAREWSSLKKLVEEQAVLPIEGDDWLDAARIVFDLRRRGVTLKNSIDSLIAQSALKRDLTVIHDDADFELIAGARPLNLARLRA